LLPTSVGSRSNQTLIDRIDAAITARVAVIFYETKIIRHLVRDFAVSIVLALWLSDHHSVGAHFGQVPLKGYW